MPEVAVLRAWQGAEVNAELSPDESDVRPAPSSPARLVTMVSAADCRRVLALKGMATAPAVAEILGADSESTTGVLDELCGDGQLQLGPGDRYLLTAEGSAAVDADYAAEATVATPVIEPHLERFHALDARFKEVVTSWQMREVEGEMTMNDHEDLDYDASVVEALASEIHLGIVEIIVAVGHHVERLIDYRHRLQAALDALNDGDLKMMANPMTDSYHTVWFELHEELIRLSGRNRADEAAAGRA